MTSAPLSRAIFAIAATSPSKLRVRKYVSHGIAYSLNGSLTATPMRLSPISKAIARFIMPILYHKSFLPSIVLAELFSIYRALFVFSRRLAFPADRLCLPALLSPTPSESESRSSGHGKRTPPACRLSHFRSLRLVRLFAFPLFPTCSPARFSALSGLSEAKTGTKNSAEKTAAEFSLKKAIFISSVPCSFPFCPSLPTPSFFPNRKRTDCRPFPVPSIFHSSSHRDAV